jgi:hypothetical protein
MPKENNRPIGENSPNLVTLVALHMCLSLLVKTDRAKLSENMLIIIRVRKSQSCFSKLQRKESAKRQDSHFSTEKKNFFSGKKSP